MMSFQNELDVFAQKVLVGLDKPSTILFFVVWTVIKVLELIHLTESAHENGSIAQSVVSCPLNITSIICRHRAQGLTKGQKEHGLGVHGFHGWQEDTPL